MGGGGWDLRVGGGGMGDWGWGIYPPTLSRLRRGNHKTCMNRQGCGAAISNRFLASPPRHAKQTDDKLELHQIRHDDMQKTPGDVVWGVRAVVERQGRLPLLLKVWSSGA